MGDAGDGDQLWPEFHPDMSEHLNTERCLVVAAHAEGLAARVASLVDKVIQSDDARPHTAGEESRTATQPSLTALAALFRVRFTTPEHVSMLEGCTAVHGRSPMLAVIDMRDEDDSYSYVLDIPVRGAAAQPPPPLVKANGTLSGYAPEAGSEAASAAAVSPGSLSCTPPAQPSEERAQKAQAESGPDVDDALGAAVEAFLRRVVAGTEPRAPQGAAPAAGDLAAPCHGVVLGEARCAVTSTWPRLLRTSLDHGEDGGALVVFWSDRCPCCPGVLKLLDAIVWGLRALANGMLARCDTRLARRLELFTFLVCNIDENDYPNADWPSRCSSGGGTGRSHAGEASRAESSGSGDAAEPLCVPSIVAYTHSERLVRTVYKKPRSVTSLVRFIVDHCIGPACVSFRFHSAFADAAMALAAALDTDALMEMPDSDDSSTARAQAAHASLTPESSAAAVETVAAALQATARAQLDAGCRRHRDCRCVGEAVAAILSSLTDCRPSPRLSSHALAHDGSDATAATDRAHDSCCVADRPSRSANASPTPFGTGATGSAAAAPSLKRPRDGTDTVADGEDGAPV